MKVCVCAWVLLSCWYLWLHSVFVSPKRVLPRQFTSFFSFCNIRRELNSPSGTSTEETERGEKEGRGRCGWEEGVWERRHESYDKMEEEKIHRGKKRRKEMSSLCSAACCVDNRSEFHKDFIKPIRETLHLISSTWPQLDQRILSSAGPHALSKEDS